MKECGRLSGYGAISEEEANAITGYVEELAKEVDNEAVEKCIKPFLETVNE